MADNFKNAGMGIIAPATRHFAITPSNTVDLANTPRALYCQTSGTVAVRDSAGVDVTYTVTAGQVLDFRAVRVLATGTTATVVGWE